MHQPPTCLNLISENFKMKLFIQQIHAKDLQYTLLCVGYWGFTKKLDIMAISCKTDLKVSEVKTDIEQNGKELNKQI